MAKGVLGDDGAGTVYVVIEAVTVGCPTTRAFTSGSQEESVVLKAVPLDTPPVTVVKLDDSVTVAEAGGVADIIKEIVEIVCANGAARERGHVSDLVADQVDVVAAEVEERLPRTRRVGDTNGSTVRKVGVFDQHPIATENGNDGVCVGTGSGTINRGDVGAGLCGCFDVQNLSVLDTGGHNPGTDDIVIPAFPCGATNLVGRDNGEVLNLDKLKRVGVVGSTQVEVGTNPGHCRG